MEQHNIMAQQRSVTVSYGTLACVIPSKDNPHLAPAVGKANSFYSFLGRAHGRGWILMTRRDIDALKDDQPHDLEFSSTLTVDGSAGKAETVKLQQIYMKRCERLTPGVKDSPGAVYLVEVVDKKYLASKMSDTDQITYDVFGTGIGEDDGDGLAGSFAGTDYFYFNNQNYDDGAGGTTAKPTRLEEAWGPLEILLGAMPDVAPLAIIETVDTHGLYAQGQSAWDYFNAVLEAAYFACCYDPIEDAFTLLQQFAAQTMPDVSKWLEKSTQDFIEFDHVRYPETYRVYFRKLTFHYGQERDSERDQNWYNHPFQTSDVTTANLVGGDAVKTVAGTTQEIYSAMEIKLNYSDGQEDAANLALQATALAQDHFDAIRLSDRKRTLYAGFQTISCGSEVKVILWRSYGTDYGGSATEIINHAGMPTGFDGPTCKIDFADRYNRPPLIDLRGLPNYPRVCNYVQLYDQTDVEEMAADAWSGKYIGPVPGPDGNVFHGRVVRWTNRDVGGTATVGKEVLEKCWIVFIGIDTPNIRHMHAIYYGRMSGQIVAGDYEESRPLYIVSDLGEHVRTGVNASGSDWTSGSMAVDLDRFADPDTGQKIRITATRTQVIAGDKIPNGATVFVIHENDQWILLGGSYVSV